MPGAFRNINLTTLANAPLFEQINRIRQARWFTFYFGNTPFWMAQHDEIPQGVGAKQVMTTHPAVTVFDISNGALHRGNRYDVTLDGYPTEITPQESFYATLSSASEFVPQPSSDLYWQVHLHGTMLVGIQ